MVDQEEREIEVQEDTIDFREIFVLVRKYIALLITLTVVFSASVFVGLRYLVADTYTASGVLYVSNKANTESHEDAIQRNDIESSIALGTTYIELLKTRDFLEDVSSKLERDYPWNYIKHMTSIKAVGETELLSIAVKAGNPEDAFDIASTIIELAPEKLLEIYDGGKVEVADSVRMPKKPDNKGVVKKSMLGGFVGLFLGLGIIFLIYIFDKKIRNASDITNKYDIPVLGEIYNGSSKKVKNITDSDNIKNILNKDSRFDIIETYKAIRTNIMFSVPKMDEGKVIVITSSCPGEGKTTSAINLAITFAQTNAKVLLLDCDLRKPRVHRYLKLDKKIGITNVICGYKTLKEAIQKHEGYNIDCITVGEVPPNPAELLGTEEFKNVLKELKKSYDYIFVDTPPLTVVTDASIIMKQCDGTLLVAREGLTTYDMFSESLAIARTTETRILGSVLLSSAEKEGKYSYYKHGKYGYKYGNKYAYKYQYQYKEEDEIKK